MEPLASIDIDLDAIRYNVRATRRLIGPETRLYGVVKGNAYGVGIREAADTLVEAGVDALAAGDASDALEIRARHPDLPILVYGTYEPEQIPELAHAGLIPTLFSLECVRAVAATDRPVRVFLEVDCGFGRLGLLETEVEAALRILAGHPSVTLTGVYTHLGQVEDPASVTRQTEQFARIAGFVRSMGFDRIETMAASSRVIISYPNLMFDAVNPGRLLYGLLDPPWRDEVDTRPVFAAVRSRLIQIKHLVPGARLGYGGLDAEGRGVIRSGVAAIGFASGLPRSMAGAPVLVQGRRATVLGLTSMEHLLIDLTGIPEATTGDEIALVGRQGDEQISGEEFARAAGLTELELLPRLGRNLKRRYLQNGEALQFGGTEQAGENPSNRNSPKRARV